MNAFTKIERNEQGAVNLTALLADLGIRKVERYINRWTVLLDDGRLGIGDTIGEAFDKATAPDASNVLKVAS